MQVATTIKVIINSGKIIFYTISPCFESYYLRYYSINRGFVNMRNYLLINRLGKESRDKYYFRLVFVIMSMKIFAIWGSNFLPDSHFIRLMASSG